MSDTHTDYDAGEFAGGTFVTKQDVMAGPQHFTIEGVSKATFEARNGRPAQEVLQLELGDERKFSLGAKTNIKILIKAYGRRTPDWIGKEIVLYHEPNVMFAGSFVGAFMYGLERLTSRLGRLGIYSLGIFPDRRVPGIGNPIPDPRRR